MSTIEMTVNSITAYRNNCANPEKIQLLDVLEKLWMFKNDDNVKLDVMCCLESHDKLNTCIPFMQSSATNPFIILTMYNDVPRFTIRDGRTNILQGIDFSRMTDLKVVKFDPDENTPNMTSYEIRFRYLMTIDYRMSLWFEKLEAKQ